VYASATGVSQLHCCSSFRRRLCNAAESLSLPVTKRRCYPAIPRPSGLSYVASYLRRLSCTTAKLPCWWFVTGSWREPLLQQQSVFGVLYVKSQRKNLLAANGAKHALCIVIEMTLYVCLIRLFVTFVGQLSAVGDIATLLDSAQHEQVCCITCSVHRHVAQTELTWS